MQENLEKSKIIKNYTFENFEKALNFVNSFGRFAEQKQFFPDLDVDYNKVKITINHKDKSFITDFLVSNQSSLDT